VDNNNKNKLIERERKGYDEGEHAHTLMQIINERKKF